MFDFLKPYEDYIFYGLVIITIIIGIIVFIKKYNSGKFSSSDIYDFIFLGYFIVNLFAFSNVRNSIINGIQEILLAIIIPVNLFFAYKYIIAKGTSKPYENVISEEENIEIEKAMYEVCAKRQFNIVKNKLQYNDTLAKIFYTNEFENFEPFVTTIYGWNTDLFKGRLFISPVVFGEYLYGFRVDEIYKEFKNLFYNEYKTFPLNPDEIEFIYDEKELISSNTCLLDYIEAKVKVTMKPTIKIEIISFVNKTKENGFTYRYNH